VLGIRLLYQRGYTREQILELFRLLDWLLRLPEALEREFLDELIAFEEQTKMPYVTSAERLGEQVGFEKGRQAGRREGRQEGEALILVRQIELRFGPPSDGVRARIAGADADTLLRWSERVLTAQTLEEVLR